MSEYPHIKGLGLEVVEKLDCDGRDSPMYKVGYVSASDLEAILSKGVEVYGDEAIDFNRGNHNRLCLYKSDNEFKGLLINYKPLAKPLEPVSKEELLDFFNTHEMLLNKGEEAVNKLIERIKQAGVKA